MATDTLDPGPDGDYPHLPRNPDGTLDTTRMPVTPYQQLTPDGRHVLIDPTKTLPNGQPVTTIAPLPPAA